MLDLSFIDDCSNDPTCICTVCLKTSAVKHLNLHCMLQYTVYASCNIQCMLAAIYMYTVCYNIHCIKNVLICVRISNLNIQTTTVLFNYGDHY